MENTEEKGGNLPKEANIVNPFLSLEEVVYAPLDALAASNAQLSRTVIDEIRRMGRTEYREGEEVLYLNKLNLAYQRMHSGEDEAYREDIQIEVPLLSVVPVPNLKIKNAEVDFSVELTEQESAQKGEIKARICAGSQRETSEEPRIDFRIKLAAVEETEGYLRILDLLNVSSVAKQLEETPLSREGTPREEEKEAFLKRQALKRQEAALHKLYREITEFMEDRKNLREGMKIGAEEPEGYDEERYERIKKNIMAEMLNIKKIMLEDKLEEFRRGGAKIE